MIWDLRSSPRRGLTAPVAGDLYQLLEPRLLLSGLTPASWTLAAGSDPQAALSITSASIAPDSSGHILAAWTNTVGQPGIYGEFLNSSLQVAGPLWLLVDPQPGTTISDSALAMNGAGNIALAWLQKNTATAQQTLYVEQFNLDGSGPSGAMAVADAVAAGTNSLTDVGIGIDTSKNMIVSWDVSDSTGLGTVYAQRLSSAGADLWASPKTIISGTNLMPSLGVASNGNFVAAWSQSQVSYQCYTSAGTTVGNVFTAAVGTSPAVALSSTGSITLAWARTDSPSNQIQTAQATFGNSAGTASVMTTTATADTCLAVTTYANLPIVAFINNSQLLLTGGSLPLYPILLAGAATQLTSPSTSTVAGKSITTWMTDSTGQGNILFMLDNGSGAGKLTQRVLVAAQAGILRFNPAVAISPDGTKFICTWIERDSTSDNVIYQVFNTDLTKAPAARTTIPIVPAEASGVLSDTAVAYSPDGSYAFTWLRNNGTNHAVWGYWTDPLAHTILAPGVLLSQSAGTDITQQRIGVQSDGNLRVIWSQYTAATTTSMILTRADQPGQIHRHAGHYSLQRHPGAGHAGPGDNFQRHAGRLARKQQDDHRRAAGFDGRAAVLPGDVVDIALCPRPELPVRRLSPHRRWQRLAAGLHRAGERAFGLQSVGTHVCDGFVQFRRAGAYCRGQCARRRGQCGPGQ